METEIGTKRPKILWSVKWVSDSKLDGHTEHLMNVRGLGVPMLFTTREQARIWIKTNYGYIAHRPDLRSQPHGWKMPRAVRVAVSITEILNGDLHDQRPATRSTHRTAR
jgi:hypothetical protein